MNLLAAKKSAFSFLIATTLVVGFSVRAFADDTDKTIAPGWNGNLCEPDSARVCLGVQGQGRDAWVQCMREHFDQLTPDCQQVMAPSNFKAPLRAEKLPAAKAAPSLMGN